MTAPSRVLTASRTLTAVKGKALYFDGADNWVDCGSDSSLDITNAITIEAWVKPALTSDYIGICEHVSGGPSNNRILIASDGRLLSQFSIGGNSDNFFSISSVDDGQWNHIVYVYDGSNELYHINGNYDSSDPESGSIATGNYALEIGRGHETTYYFKGTIALVRIYERALSASEVLYNKEHPYNPILHGCVLWLGYDSIDEGAGIWRDKSGYGNNGTIYGATAVEMNKLAGRVLSV